MVAAVVLAVFAIGARDVSEGKAGEGFTYRSVSFEKSALEGFVKVIGEMTNWSGKNYRSVSFDLTLYDSLNEVLAVDKFLIQNFKNGSTRPMKTMLKVDFAKISAYKIDFSSARKERK